MNNKAASSGCVVSVIVPVFNHWSLVPALLESLAWQTLGVEVFELLLVDNGSNDIPKNIVLPDWARLLLCKKPGSYAARNFGVRAARGRVLAFTDADCLPREDWLEKALFHLTERGERHTLVAGGVSIEPVDWSVMTPSEMFDVVMGLPQKRYVSHGYAVTANLIVPAQAIEQVGIFDEGRFSGGDAEFCRRAVLRGWALSYCPEAEVVHPARREWVELKVKQRRVMGGQLTAGSLHRRLVFFVAALFPPLRQWYFALRSGRLSFKQRLRVCWLLLRLWLVSFIELVRLMSGGTPERR